MGSNAKKQSNQKNSDYSIIFISIVWFWKIFLMMTIQILAFVSQGKSGGLANTNIGLSQKGVEDLIYRLNLTYIFTLQIVMI